MTDKGYDSDANRLAARARGVTPVIPRRENSKQRGRFFPKRLYKLRARIEQTIGKLKRFKRVAMRCEKTDISYSAIISFACGLMLVKSVHTAIAVLQLLQGFAKGASVNGRQRCDESYGSDRKSVV